MFRSRQRKSAAVRKRPSDEEDPENEGEAGPSSQGEDERSLAERLADARAVQKMRERKSGVDAQEMIKVDKRPADTKEEKEKDDPGKLGVGLQHKKRLDPAQTYEERMQEFVNKELARLKGEEPKLDPEAERQRELRELMEIPEHLKGQQTELPTIPGQWTTAMQEVGMSKADRLKAIEKTEAAKGELLSRARLLGVEDDERHPEAPKFSRKELPFEFGRKRQRK